MRHNRDQSKNEQQVNQKSRDMKEKEPAGPQNQQQ
jgi:hypothetical protein